MGQPKTSIITNPALLFHFFPHFFFSIFFSSPCYYNLLQDLSFTPGIYLYLEIISEEERRELASNLADIQKKQTMAPKPSLAVESDLNTVAPDLPLGAFDSMLISEGDDDGAPSFQDEVFVGDDSGAVVFRDLDVDENVDTSIISSAHASVSPLIKLFEMKRLQIMIEFNNPNEDASTE